MKFQAAAVSVTAVLSATSAAAQSSQCAFQVGSPVNTTSGLLQGHRAPNATQVSEYLGIPFAQPPVDQLRFAPPAQYTSNASMNASNYVSFKPAQFDCRLY